ncbi:hypothetical protein DPMN_137478 [Dreissena polymorpha]|uniref:Uncharacterized protein n=1 Tax=Dreissena polymorpha TaxID=45954 RepID=A0A9D4G5U4_DREPO|nr:hypothetical protein DPMN_137478 [Dreissena polymorpha]
MLEQPALHLCTVISPHQVLAFHLCLKDVPHLHGHVSGIGEMTSYLEFANTPVLAYFD